MLLVSCNQKRGADRTDTTTSGVARVVTDDCLTPLVKEQVGVFEGLHPEATIELQSTSELEAFKQLYADSVRLIVAARDLTSKEKKVLLDKGLLPRSTKIAVDGIALIVNNQNRDTLITTNQFKQILDGKILNWKELSPKSTLGKIQVVFDNAGSSTVRYMRDSISRGKIKSPNVYAQNSNQEVLDYVAKTPNAMGVIGVSWISSTQDTALFSFTNRIRVMSVSPFDEADEDNSYLPYPAYLILEKYPFRRDIFMIITDPGGYLPSGFMNFVGGQYGQRLVLKMGMVPANAPMRIVQVKE